MKTKDLIEGQTYQFHEKGNPVAYRYNGKDGGGKHVFVKCHGFGMKVFGKLTIEIPALTIHNN